MRKIITLISATIITLASFAGVANSADIPVTGTPNSGKSSLTLEIALRTAREHGFKFLIFSPESSLAVNLKRLVEKYCQKPFDIMFHNRADETEVLEAIEFITLIASIE